MFDFINEHSNKVKLAARAGPGFFKYAFKKLYLVKPKIYKVF
jgi:hypothetical protein